MSYQGCIICAHNEHMSYAVITLPVNDDADCYKIYNLNIVRIKDFKKIDKHFI